MKRNLKKDLIVLIALFLVSAFAFSLEGTVQSVTGKVEVQTSSGWESLKVGDSVVAGRIISTGFRSQAVIQIAGSNIVVNQLSRLTLEQLAETNDSHESKVFLDLGSIRADVQRAENKRVGFVVNTPVATASVRGTGFDMGLRQISVDSGLIEYVGTKGFAVPVSAGNKSNVSNDGKATKPFINKVKSALGNENEGEEGALLPSFSATSFNAASDAKSSEISTGTVIVTVDALNN